MEMNEFVLTVSYADYTKSTGGTDKTILAQQNVFNSNSVTVFHIFPVRHIWRVKLSAEYVWGLCVDGVWKAFYDTQGVLCFLQAQIRRGLRFRGVIIHHLMHISLHELSALLDCMETSIFMYIHDYMTICSAGGLARDGKKFCGASSPTSEKCAQCSLFSESLIKRTSEISSFFAQYKDRITFVFPSETAKRVWLSVYGIYASQTVVAFHQTCVGTYMANISPVMAEEPLKVAFIGYQSPIKGWYYWINAAKKLHEAGTNYELFQIGSCNDHFDYINEINLDFRLSLTAMTDALREKQIHCAVLWSVIPETYSFTYYEAFSANCFVLTSEASGNIAEQTHNRGNGYCADSPEELEQLLLNEDMLRNLVNDFRSKGLYGPETLRDSDFLVELTKSENCEIHNCCKMKINRKLICKFLETAERIYSTVKKRMKARGHR